MKTEVDATSELAREIKVCEPFSDARAILDYQVSMQSTKNWIVSHEALRRVNQELEKQIRGQSLSIQEMRTAMSSMRNDVSVSQSRKAKLESATEKVEQLQSELAAVTSKERELLDRIGRLERQAEKATA